MRWMIFALFTLFSGPATAQDQSGDFDYYVVSLSWSPNWCVRTGDARGSEQCQPGTGLGWILHGLWPQFETGWPASCSTSFPAPSQQLLNSMRDIQGTSDLARHEWRKHGTCSGLSPQGYFQTSRLAYNSIARPESLRPHSEPREIPAKQIEDVFLSANPALTPDSVTVTCRDQHVHEVRICLTKGLMPRSCGADVRKDCTRPDAILYPVR